MPRIRMWKANSTKMASLFLQSQPEDGNNNPTTRPTLLCPISCFSLTDTEGILEAASKAFRCSGNSIGQYLLNDNYAQKNYALRRLYTWPESSLGHPAIVACSRVHSQTAQVGKIHTTQYFWWLDIGSTAAEMKSWGKPADAQQVNPPPG